MDLQQAMLSVIPEPDAFLERWNAALTAARDAGMLVVHIRAAFRPGHPEVSPDNRMYSRLAKTGSLVDGSAEAAIAAGLSVEPGDLVITKLRVSAFSGSGLEILLRAHDIRSLTMFGVATSGIVLSTVRLAADLDFELTVLGDACFDPDHRVHDILLNSVFPRQADVIDTAEWIAALAGPPRP